MLARDHMAFYIVTDESPETIFQTTLDFGVDMYGLSREGRLKIVNCYQWSIINGKIEASRIAELWQKACEETVEKRMKELAICEEMGCFFQKNSVKELTKYEKHLGRKLVISSSVKMYLRTALCHKLMLPLR
jgi:KaiC/GvpD/RAD55 family RecA-like ATPase